MSVTILFKLRRFAPIALHVLALASLFASQYTNLCLTALAGGSVLRRVFDPGLVLAIPKNSKQRSKWRTRVPSKLLKCGIHYLALVIFVILLAGNGLAIADNKLMDYPRTSTAHIVGLDICMAILLYQRFWCMGLWNGVSASRKIKKAIVVQSPKGKKIASYHRFIATAEALINAVKTRGSVVNRLGGIATGSVASNRGPASNVTPTVEGSSAPGPTPEPAKLPSIQSSLCTGLADNNTGPTLNVAPTAEGSPASRPIPEPAKLPSIQSSLGTGLADYNPGPALDVAPVVEGSPVSRPVSVPAELPSVQSSLGTDLADYNTGPVVNVALVVEGSPASRPVSELAELPSAQSSLVTGLADYNPGPALYIATKAEGSSVPKPASEPAKLPLVQSSLGTGLADYNPDPALDVAPIVEGSSAPEPISELAKLPSVQSSPGTGLNPGPALDVTPVVDRFSAPKLVSEPAELPSIRSSLGIGLSDYSPGSALNVAPAVEGSSSPKPVLEPAKLPSIRSSLGTGLADYDAGFLARTLKKAQARSFIAGEAFETVPSFSTMTLVDTTQVFINVLRKPSIKPSTPGRLVYSGCDFVPRSGLISVPLVASTVELPSAPTDSSESVLGSGSTPPSSVEAATSSVEVHTAPVNPPKLIYKGYEFVPAKTSLVTSAAPTRS